jgi:archaeosine synthase alpha-subunit
VTRRAERIEGLALDGPATLGTISLRVPAVLWAAVPGRSPGPSGPTISEAPGAPPARRRLTIRAPEAELPLEFAVEAPEVSGTRGSPQRVAEGVFSLHWPIDPAAWPPLQATRPEVVILANARALLAEGEPFVRAIGELRDRLGTEPLLWAPRTALPHRVALLIYVGIDLLDSTESLVRSAEGEFLTPSLGPIAAEAVQAELGCPCAACSKGEPSANGGHAEWMLDQELRLVRASLRAGRLRELVEARLATEPLLAELLRYSDRHLAGLVESRAPVTGAGVGRYVLRDSLRRPEARRFRQRFLERYRPPPSKCTLLLVECSRTKPYRSSPSHRRLMRVLEGIPNRALLHVVSVTSPLGLVPRELEDVPPARHYDIPVTHEWDEEEREMVTTALRHLLASGRYRAVLVHLDPAEYAFLRPVVEGAPGFQWTGGERHGPRAETLDALRSAAHASLAGRRLPDGGPLAVVREELECVALYQFGADAARRLFEEPVRLMGRPWFQKLQDPEGHDLATLREERGLFQLTVQGGQRMLPAHPLEVELKPDVPLTGDLFVPGVLRADPGIRTGDAVLATREGALVAVGEAALPGPLMTELSRGLAVRLRHRSRGRFPTSGEPSANGVPE